MAPIQWLLIGGAHHGRTLWIKQGGRVAVRNGADVVVYKGENYHCDGKLYRIGRHQPTAEQVSYIPVLIAEKRLQPVA